MMWQFNKQKANGSSQSEPRSVSIITVPEPALANNWAGRPANAVLAHIWHEHATAYSSWNSAQPWFSTSTCLCRARSSTSRFVRSPQKFSFLESDLRLLVGWTSRKPGITFPYQVAWNAFTRVVNRSEKAFGTCSLPSMGWIKRGCVSVQEPDASRFHGPDLIVWYSSTQDPTHSNCKGYVGRRFYNNGLICFLGWSILHGSWYRRSNQTRSPQHSNRSRNGSLQ